MLTIFNILAQNRSRKSGVYFPRRNQLSCTDNRFTTKEQFVSFSINNALFITKRQLLIVVKLYIQVDIAFWS